MSFIDISYPFFLFTVCSIYFLIPHKYRWVLLLASSYFFYSSWKPEYLLIIIFSTLISYFVALLLHKHNKHWNLVLFTIGIIAVLSPLLYFKYSNFFLESTGYLFNIQFDTIKNLILPIGISFYTFQSLGYLVDVYNKDRVAEKHLGLYALYISFFPQLVAGPIERSSKLIPQFQIIHNFDWERIKSALRLILWGAFKKIVIADYLSVFVNKIYGNIDSFHPLYILIATYFFAAQIYCDFSGYTDIALGSAKIMGFDLTQNFNNPYFSKSLKEFWRRWHISLSNWFKECVYLPLGGDKVSKVKWVLNIFIVFCLSGLWHGASITFVLWGFIHALLFTVENFFKNTKLPRVLSQILTFNLVVFTWVFFRANNFHDLKNIFYKLTSTDLGSYIGILKNLIFHSVELYFQFKTSIHLGVLLIILLSIIDYFKNKITIFTKEDLFSVILSNLLLALALIMILIFYNYANSPFIYFQF